MKPYSNPPINEALIDIKVDPQPHTVLPALEDLYEFLKGAYPEKKARYRWEGSLAVTGDLISTAQRQIGPDGYLFQSSDGQRVVQCRLDGFTFNQLRPYPSQGWPVVRQEAKRIWEIYTRMVQPKHVTRIGLRYINRIDIPGARIDLDEYLTAAPKIPDGLPQTLQNFLSRVEIPFQDELETIAIVTQAQTSSPDPQFTSVLLDIDVLTQTRMTADTERVWQVLDQFREKKNMIFKGSIRPKTEELFQ